MIALALIAGTIGLAGAAASESSKSDLSGVSEAETAPDLADRRARRLVEALTLNEKISLLHTQFGVVLRERPRPEGALGSAGFNAGVPRLGIPPLQETDAGLGVANPESRPYQATALPSSLALGAAFDPDLAYAAGAVVGAEARALGFSVLLGGASNLIRDPRGGRNFEYVSEDPLLTGAITGAEIAGVQSRRIVSTMKHFALNAQENGRVMLNAVIDEASFRESDLLAFELAIERGAPGSVMTSYNSVGGTHTSEHAHLMNEVLKRDWGFQGWIMADWGGTHSTEKAVLAGLDQQSGEESDVRIFFGPPLKAAVEAGRIPMARLDEMVFRLLRTQIALGVFDDPPKRGAPIDYAAHARVAEKEAARGIVLLKNDKRFLPLGPHIRTLLVVGGDADIGVMSGGGSSQVVPRGARRFKGIPPELYWGEPRLVVPSPPFRALRERLKGVEVSYLDGQDRRAAVAAAGKVDAVVVVASRWSNESIDLEDLTLTFDQDGLIKEIAAANPQTAVVLETPSGVTMPWLGAVRAVVEAWYPGARGGEAIADVLTGRVNPSGRLPVSFPASVEELPRPKLPLHGSAASYPRAVKRGVLFDVDYNIEGADVGYKWYLKTGRKPLFPFGFGLSYTSFAVSGVEAAAKDGTIAVDFDVRNTGDREGIDIPQVYVEGAGFTRRLVGWGNASLKPGETRHVSLTVDPRLLARFDVATDGWRIDGGLYRVSVRPNALDDGPVADVRLDHRVIPARHGGCGTAGTVCAASKARAKL